MEYIQDKQADIVEELCGKNSAVCGKLAAILLICTQPEARGHRMPRVFFLEASTKLLFSTRLSQRTYNHARKLMKRQGVQISPYRKASRCLRDLDVGRMAMGQHDPAIPRQDSGCMCASTKVIDTLQQIFSKEHFYSQLFFTTPEMQQRLCSKLRQIYPVLY